MYKTQLLIVVGITCVTLGCASLPSQGPRVSDIHEEYDQAETKAFELVRVTNRTVGALKKHSTSGFYTSFGDTRPAPSPKIGIGDSIAVTIWEAGQSSMFSSNKLSSFDGMGDSAGKSSSIPIQMVSRDGRITVPYVGQVSVVDRTPYEVQMVIQDALSGISVEPQVLVSIAKRAASAVTIVGEVISGARVPLDVYSYRLLDVIAAAGGVRIPLHEAFVQVTRGNNAVTVAFGDILERPIENIQMHPGDVIAILRRPKSYTVFGAAGRNSQITFDTPDLTLLEALAKSGGLVDALADPKGVFVFRYEAPDTVRSISDSKKLPIGEKGVPVIYQVDLSKAGSYFNAQSFEVRNRDVLYVSSAPTTELQKFLMLVGLISQPIITGATVTSVADDN